MNVEKSSPAVCHGEIDACAVDGGFDLGAGANDAGVILQQARDVGFAQARHLLWIEVVEGFAEGVALAQDR